MLLQTDTAGSPVFECMMYNSCSCQAVQADLALEYAGLGESAYFSAWYQYSMKALPALAKVQAC